jgi:hypothetical protein
MIRLARRHRGACLLLVSLTAFASLPAVAPSGHACDPDARAKPPEGALTEAGKHTSPRVLDLPPDIASWEFTRSVLGASGYNSDCQPTLTSVTDPDITPYLYYVAADQVGPPYDPNDVWAGFSIYEARWDGARWTDVRVLPAPVNPGGFPSVTRDGGVLYFVQAGRIKKAIRSAGEFDTVVPLGWPFNVTGINYEAPEIARDKRRLYFVMDGVFDGQGQLVAPAPGQPRNRDIWVVRVNGAAFDSLTNLGSGVNTTGVETRPTIDPGGTRLLFSDFGGDRPGEADFGGVDLFVSVYENGAWQPAQPLPAPVNNDYPACSAHWADDGSIYMGSEVSEGGFGEEDIWHTQPVGVVPALPDNQAEPVHDGPATAWTLLASFPGVVVVHDLLGLDAHTLLAATAPGGRVYRSIDGGLSWTGVVLEEGTIRVYDLARASDGTVYAGTYPYGKVFRSTDGGATWTAGGALPGAPAAVRALLPLSNGDLLAGVAPEQENTPPAKAVGRVCRSANGGTTWIDSGTLADVETGVYALSEVAPGIVMAGARGYGAYVYRSTNYGLTWAKVPLFAADSTPGLVDVFATVNDTVWAGGWKHGTGGVLAYSTNAGAAWTRVILPAQANDVEIARVFDVARTAGYGWLMGIHPGVGTIAWGAVHPLGTWSPYDHLEDARELLALEELPDGRVLAGTSGFGEIWVLGGAPVDVHEDLVPPRFDLVLRNPTSRSSVGGALDLPSAGPIEVDLFDVRGAHLGTVFRGTLAAGRQSVAWSLERRGGAPLRRGVYLLRVAHGGRFVARKLVVGVD